MITPAEARAIIDRHHDLGWTAEDRITKADLPEWCVAHDDDTLWPCDANLAATAYLASVAENAALRRLMVLEGWQVEDIDAALPALADALFGAKP